VTYRIGLFAVFGAIFIALSGNSNLANAGTLGGVYNMDGMLYSTHPFQSAPAAARASALKPAAAKVLQSWQRKRAQQSVAERPNINVAAEDSPQKSSGLISEIRIGGLVHDEGPFSHNKESGYDGNLEILFTSPNFLSAVWSPRPHIGMSINSDSNTNQGYLGLTWEWDFLKYGFFDFSLGGAYHDGEHQTDDRTKKSLGCSFLFRESLDLGIKIADIHSLSVHLAHISNAKLCSTNEGMESFGIRYGIRF